MNLITGLRLEALFSGVRAGPPSAAILCPCSLQVLRLWVSVSPQGRQRLRMEEDGRSCVIPSSRSPSTPWAHSLCLPHEAEVPLPQLWGNQSTPGPLHPVSDTRLFEAEAQSTLFPYGLPDLHFLTWGVCDIPRAIIRGFDSLFPEGIRSRSFCGLEAGVWSRCGQGVHWKQVQPHAARRGGRKIEPSSGPGPQTTRKEAGVFAARRCVPGLRSFHRLSLLILMTMPEGEHRGPPFCT